MEFHLDTAQITNNEIYGLTSSQIAKGKNMQAGNQLLITRPPLDTSHPWAGTKPPAEPPPSDGTLSIKLVSDTGRSAADHITSNATVEGVGDPDLLVTIREGSGVLGTTRTDDEGAWTFTPNLTDGAHTHTAVQGDDTASLNLALDKTPPAVTLRLAYDTGASATDNVTSYPAIKGIGQANTAVTIKEGSATVGTTIADINGNRSFVSKLGDGIHTLTPPTM